ncbi:MAG: AAA family ATPase [Candidatus Bathyarchaeia archaeon]|jgi:predicted ATPase
MWNAGLLTMLTSGVLVEPVLVGRDQELEELQLFLNSAVEGKGTIVLISGEAGTGKTRLIKEFLNSAKQKEDVLTLGGYCLSNAGVPYFPFFEAFTNYFTAENNQENQPVAPSLTQDQTHTKTRQIRNEEQVIKSWLMGPTQDEATGKYETLAPQVWKDQTFVTVAQTLSAISDEKPIILFLEDIHWADSASLALMHYIGRAIGSKRILVLATFRSEALTVNAQGRPHPLVETLRQMRREDLYKEIKLPNLDQTSVSEIAKSMLGGDLQREFVEKLTKESQGNPLYIVETLRMLHESHSLIQENDQWRFSVNEIGMPAKIKDIILQRLSTLTRNQRRVLDAASVIGEKFDVELLGAALGQDSLEVVETLNAVAQSTSMVFCEGDVFRFDHAKSRDAIYEEVLLVLKKGYHAKIAKRLESASKGGKLQLGDLAYHYAMADNKEKAVKYALVAGEDALARWSNQEAIKHFTYVLESVSENPENSETRRKAQEGLGDAYYANSMFKEATRTFENIGKNEMGVVKLRALRKGMESAFQYMDMRHLMELVKEAEPYADVDRLENARILMNRARVRMFENFALSLEDYEAALRVFEEEYSLWDAALTLVGVGTMHPLAGQPQKGIAECLRAIALFEELGDFRFQMEACWAAGIMFVDLLLYHEALTTCAKAVEIDEKTKMGDYNKLVYANAFSAWAHERMGDWEEALSYSLKALEASKKTDNLIAPGIVYNNLCREYVRLGDLKHAEEYFEKLMKLPPEAQTNLFAKGALTKAVFFAGKGQLKESNQCFKEYIESLKVGHLPGTALSARLFYGWSLERQGRVEENRVQGEEIEKLYRNFEERFAHVSLQASLMVHREVTVDEEFEMRLDLVNVSRKPSLLVKAIGVIPSEGFKAVVLTPWCSLQNGSIEMENREIGAFQVVTAKLALRAVKTGAYTLSPKIVYIDELGETETSSLQPAKIHVEPGSSTIKEERVTSTTSASFEFKSEVTQKAFDYLASAFVEDYMRRRIAQEKAGWRSLMRIVDEGKLSKSSMYGSRGRKGRALIELESRGLVEARFFPGERGRGGKILKLRVVYENEIIKHLIDNQIMKKKKE